MIKTHKPFHFSDFTQFKAISSPDTTSKNSKNINLSEILNKSKYYLKQTSTKQFRQFQQRQTSKKNIAIKKHNKHLSLQELKNQIIHLNFQQDLMIDKQKYNKISQLQSRIQAEQKSYKKACIFRVEEEHEKQKKILYKAHKKQLTNFNSFWNQIFQDFKQKSSLIKRKMQHKIQKQLNKQFQIFDLKLKRDFSAKKRKILINFGAKKNLLIKCKRYGQLSVLKEQKQKQVQHSYKQIKIQFEQQNRIRSQSMTLFDKKISKSILIKQNSLFQKIKEAQNQKIKVFRSQRNKLKQKYQNIMTQMHHQHRIELIKLQKNLKHGCLRTFSAFI